MNPAALKVHLPDLRKGATIIVNVNEFTKGNLSKAGYESNPLDQPGFKQTYRLYEIEVGRLVREALAESGLSAKEIDRSKNFFCLGFVSWLYNRPIEPTVEWTEAKFKKLPLVRDANIKVLKAGYFYGDTIEAAISTFDLEPATYDPGLYRQISGNQALALGIIAAATQADRPVVFGAYPITPASDILHHLNGYRHFRVRPIQAEDEIAAMGAVVGAAFGGAIAVTASSGPGIALKGEAMGLAVKTELPLVIINVQRGGPSTGLPTKTEQADLMQALYGRNGECPLIVLAPCTPSDCFQIAYEAVRLSVKYMTPVMILSDGYLANGSEPWKVPSVSDLPAVPLHFATDPATYQPYLRDEATLARPWAIPGTKGLEHRIGGLEGQNATGNVSYDAENHDLMVRLREEKVRRVVTEIPPLECLGDNEGELLLVGWGSTYGTIRQVVEEARADKLDVSAIHIRHLSPLPSDLGATLKRFKKVLVPEINRGQLLRILRAEFLVNAEGFNRVTGQPLDAGELRQAINDRLAPARDEGATKEPKKVKSKRS
jgi:2-oxoglutarate ferredoxin oxidoreductase subunit alpha